MLSVIVPTYNRPAMLASCLESIAQCTLLGMEVLVADDGARPEPLGVQANVADALRGAIGEYLCVVPDDDTVNPGNFERKVAILDAHPEVGFVYSMANVMDEAGRVLGVAQRNEFMEAGYAGGRDEFRDLLSGNWIYGASVVWRRSLYDQLGYQDEAIPATLADWDVWLRYSRAMATAYIAEPLVNVRLHAEALSSRKSAGMPAAMLLVWRKWLLAADAPVLDRRIWAQMEHVFRSEINRCIQSIPEAEKTWQEFVDMKAEYHQRLRDRAA